LGFLRRGLTYAVLKADEKPWVKERLASFVMSGENVVEQDLISEVGMMSSGDDLSGMVRIDRPQIKIHTKYVKIKNK